MKQLFLDDEPMQVFFNGNVKFTNLLQWVIDQTIFSKDNIFSLNEQHSCVVRPNERDMLFIISGDEDLKSLTFEEIKSIL